MLALSRMLDLLKGRLLRVIDERPMALAVEEEDLDEGREWEADLLKMIQEAVGGTPQ